MSKMKFKLNGRGVAKLMKSSEMQTILNKHASRAKSKAGRGYEQAVAVGKNRAYANIWAETKEAKSDNSKNNTLLKSVR